MNGNPSTADLCRECVEAIWPHWNKCEEGKCVVADTYDAAAQADHHNPCLPTLAAMAALDEGDHGYCEHVASHWAIAQSLTQCPSEGEGTERQLPLFEGTYEAAAAPEEMPYEDIGL